MAMTENPKPYKRGPAGLRDAAVDVAIILQPGGMKKKAQGKKEKSKRWQSLYLDC